MVGVPSSSVEPFSFPPSLPLLPQLIENTLGELVHELTSASELPAKLEDGVLLCRVLNAVVEDKYKVDIRLKASSIAAKRRNGTAFVDTCRRLNISSITDVTALDILQGKATRHIVTVLRELVHDYEGHDTGGGRVGFL